jgi:hypothetical protein
MSEPTERLAATEVVRQACTTFQDHPEAVAWAYNGGRYRCRDGRMCPIGMWLVRYDRRNFENKAIGYLLRIYGLEILDPRVRHLPVDLFRYLQTAHDQLWAAQLPQVRHRDKEGGEHALEEAWKIARAFDAGTWKEPKPTWQASTCLSLPPLVKGKAPHAG